MTIAEIVDRTAEYQCGKKRRPKKTEIVSVLPTPNDSTNYETIVFNYLFENKDSLEIRKIYQLKNSSVDGLLELTDNRTILLEIKYALNWDKCSTARIQFHSFLARKLYSELSVDTPTNALILFHKFTRDWARRNAKNVENGWNYFYEEEDYLNQSLIKTDIAQLLDGHLVYYPGIISDD